MSTYYRYCCAVVSINVSIPRLHDGPLLNLIYSFIRYRTHYVRNASDVLSYSGRNFVKGRELSSTQEPKRMPYNSSIGIVVAVVAEQADDEKRPRDKEKERERD